jgi:parvulin-like peptidyl-prolyl isomerase
MLAALFLQASLLVKPLVLGDAPPETRAIAAVTLTDMERGVVDRWRTQAAAGSPEFLAFARTCAQKPSSSATGVVGTFWKSMLAQETGEFLFGAAVGSVNQHVEQHPDAFAKELIAVRLERDAAVRQILVSGTDESARAKAEAILRELKAGADFAQLAREKSDDKVSALRGGDLAIFERGSNDELLRKAAFETRVGDLAGPIASPLGFHILQRVPVESMDPRLRDDLWCHARAILVAFGGAKGADPTLVREHEEAEKIANDLAARIRRGEDMAAVAKSFNDDRGGKERGGDLGWIRRGVTSTPPFLDRLFLEPPGTLIGPLASQAGFVMFRREDPGPRSRIDLRKSAFVQMEAWVRRGSNEKADDWIAAATSAGNKLFSAMREGKDRNRLIAIATQCADAADFVRCCQLLPERTQLPSSAPVELRRLARDYAEKLAAIEPRFLADRWPRTGEDLDRYLLSGARHLFTQFGDSALDEILRDLDMRDPRIVVPVYVVAGHDDSQVLGQTPNGSYACVVEINLTKTSEQELIHEALNQATRALDTETRNQPTVLSQLRRRMDSDDAATVEKLEALIWFESWAVVPRVFDVDITKGIAFGAAQAGQQAMEQALTDFRTSDAGRRLWPVVGPWRDHFFGLVTREAALDAIVEAAKAKK